MQSCLAILKWLPLGVLMLIGVLAGRFTWQGSVGSSGSVAGSAVAVRRTTVKPKELARIRWIGEVRPGPYRPQAVKVSRDDFAGGLVASPALESMLKGLKSSLAHSLRKRGKAPLLERIARVTWDPEFSEEALDSGCKIYPGDVFISGIPMIDQGNKAYCAVASAARVLQGYGIEVTMEDMATLANSSETGGTSLSSWDAALRKVAGEHGLELKIVSEVTETMTPLSQLIYEYNHTARELGYDDLYAWNYTGKGYSDYAAYGEDREYAVQREVMLGNDRKSQAFDDNVLARVDESDPLFWTVTLGDVPEELPQNDGEVASLQHGAHMRLIVGYNEERGEVLYSDSWGEGHELKRMDAQDALSITRGLFYLTD